MLGKIINTMFHGSLKAKLFLWSVFVMILGAVFMGVLAAVMVSSTFLAGAVSCAVAALVVSQSVSLSELNKKKTPAGQKKKRKSPQKKRDKKAQREIDEGAPVDSSEKAKAKARYLASMNEKKMKQLLKEHKVKQIHVLAMVDFYPELRVRQTPAVLWQTNTHLHILMLDGRATEAKVPLADIRGILLEKNVPANPEEDYVPFQYSNFISKLYKPYLPTCQEISDNGEIGYVKTLFTIEPGISFTNTSMAGLMKILSKVPLLVNDPINTSPRFDEYFKEVYRYSLLCKNGVFPLEEYRDRMEGVLEELLLAPITADQFAKSLRDMSNYHLITMDYVTKYTQRYITKNKG